MDLNHRPSLCRRDSLPLTYTGIKAGDRHRTCDIQITDLALCQTELHRQKAHGQIRTDDLVLTKDAFHQLNYTGERAEGKS